MQKIISSLFVFGAKPTTQQSLEVMLTTEAQFALSSVAQSMLFSSQSSQDTSLIVNGSLSGEEITTMSTKFTIDEGLLLSDEIISHLNSVDVSVPQDHQLQILLMCLYHRFNSHQCQILLMHLHHIRSCYNQTLLI